jgi:RNA polymerase-binding transcription factor DksA
MSTIEERNRVRRAELDDEPFVFGACCECGEDIYKPGRRRCNPCAVAKYL